MNDEDEPPDNSALGSVRQLEGALEAASTMRAESEARLEEARADAARLIAAARVAAATAVAERRRIALAAVEDDAAEISRQGEARAARVLVDARSAGATAVEAALALILPMADTGEA